MFALAAVILIISLTSQVSVTVRNSCRTAYNSCPEGDNSIQNYLTSLLDKDVVPVKQGNDRVRSFLNTNNMVRIQKHCLPVQACNQDHRCPVIFY
jgi:hypothetical protein